MKNYHPQDLLSSYTAELHWLEISKERQRLCQQHSTDYWKPVAELFDRLPATNQDWVPGSYKDSPVIGAGLNSTLDQQSRLNVRSLVKQLAPWRKGPFRLFDIEIDAEWRSDKKWDRISPHLGDITGARLADIGCGNGYYMFRLAGLNPECVVGFDPSLAAHNQFRLMQHFISCPIIQHELLGIEHLSLFDSFFDLILCMGVIYHRKNPLLALETLAKALKPGGRLIVETLAIPGEDPVALCPPERYSKMRNVYFIPSASCLEGWLKRSGFADIKLLCSAVIDSSEQRKTELAPFESLEDFLDPSDCTRTIEGFPAPFRIAIMANLRDKRLSFK